MVALVAASCGGGSADTTASTVATTTSTAPTSTTAPPTSTTTSSSSSTTTSSTSTTTTVPEPAGFVRYTHPMFELSHPETWTENPEFPGTGVGFIEDHSALALPPTTLDVFLEQQEPGFDLDANVERIIESLEAFVPDFRILESGETEVDGVRSIWFEYADDFTGFPVVIREQSLLRDNVLVTFTLNAPEEFFAFDRSQVEITIDSFRFS